LLGSSSLLDPAFHHEVYNRRRLHSAICLAEWDNQELFVDQGEDAAIDKDGKIIWVRDRQTRLHLVK
jgi:hypothetical protein